MSTARNAALLDYYKQNDEPWTPPETPTDDDYFDDNQLDEEPESNGYFDTPDPGMVNVFTANRSQLAALFERANWFVEMWCAVWGEGAFKSCWRFHNDVLLYVVGLERAWTHVCSSDQKDWRELGGWLTKIDDVRSYLGKTSMSECKETHKFPKPTPELAEMITQRRSYYLSPRWLERDTNVCSFPSFDAAGGSLGLPENQLQYDGINLQ